MDYRWLTVIGLLLDIAGAFFMAKGLIISKARALELGVAKWGHEADRDNLALPQVADRLMQSRNAIAGTILLVAGFLCQLVASWPR